MIGVPCNQFGKQEPGTAAEIGAFCEKNYGVTFPMTAKSDVKGRAAHPFYGWAAAKRVPSASRCGTSTNI